MDCVVPSAGDCFTGESRPPAQCHCGIADPVWCHYCHGNMEDKVINTIGKWRGWGWTRLCLQQDLTQGHCDEERSCTNLRESRVWCTVSSPKNLRHQRNALQDAVRLDSHSQRTYMSSNIWIYEIWAYIYLTPELADLNKRESLESTQRSARGHSSTYIYLHHWTHQC